MTEKPSQYLVIGKASCPFCVKAKNLLDNLEIPFTYVELNNVNPSDMKSLQSIAGQEFQTVPIIFKYKVGGGLDYIGGFTDLDAVHSK